MDVRVSLSLSLSLFLFNAAEYGLERVWKSGFGSDATTRSLDGEEWWVGGVVSSGRPKK